MREQHGSPGANRLPRPVRRGVWGVVYRGRLRDEHHHYDHDDHHHDDHHDMMRWTLFCVFLAIAGALVYAQDRGAAVQGHNSIIGRGGGGGSCPTTTTTTLPGCDPVGEIPCGTCGGAGGICLPTTPGNFCVCADIGNEGEACDFDNPCTSDADCAASHFCFDFNPVGGGGSFCCPACASGQVATQCPATTTTTLPPCNAPIFCRCAGDSFTPCASDADCAPDRFCQNIDSETGTHFCYRLTCTGGVGCAVNQEAACTPVCEAHGGVFASFCQDGTCVGGDRDGLSCFTTFSTIECPGGACSGPGLCNCAFTCRPLTPCADAVTCHCSGGNPDISRCAPASACESPGWTAAICQTACQAEFGQTSTGSDCTSDGCTPAECPAIADQTNLCICPTSTTTTTEEPTTTTTTTSTTTTTTCLANGEVCAVNGDCCSNNCVLLVCAP